MYNKIFDIKNKFNKMKILYYNRSKEARGLLLFPGVYFGQHSQEIALGCPKSRFQKYILSFILDMLTFGIEVYKKTPHRHQPSMWCFHFMKHENRPYASTKQHQ
jgi:hypothetical protein